MNNEALLEQLAVITKQLAEAGVSKKEIKQVVDSNYTKPAVAKKPAIKQVDSVKVADSVFLYKSLKNTARRMSLNAVQAELDIIFNGMNAAEIAAMNSKLGYSKQSKSAMIAFMNRVVRTLVGDAARERF